jgi:hypothetical protein
LETGRETYGANDAQPIFLEAMPCITNGANHAPLKVFLTFHQVDQSVSDRIIDHAIDGKVTAKNIFFQTPIAHVAGSATIQIRPVMTKARHLEGLAVDQHQDDAELRPDRNGLGKDALNILRLGVGRNIVVLWQLLQQHIAHAPTGKKRLIAFLTEASNDKNSLFTR